MKLGAGEPGEGAAASADEIDLPAAGQEAGADDVVAARPEQVGSRLLAGPA